MKRCIIPVRYSYEFGYNGMKQALCERTKGLTAVFAMADVIAIGAIRALFDEGLRVPEDISVVGYDGLRIGDFYVPKLTTISQSVELLAKRSFELLISCMQGAPAQHLTVPFRLLTPAERPADHRIEGFYGTKQRNSAAYHIATFEIRHWKSGKGSLCLCGFPEAGGAEILADSAALPAGVRRLAVSGLFDVCGQSVSD